MVRSIGGRPAPGARHMLRTILYAACFLAAGAIIAIRFPEDQDLGRSAGPEIEDVDRAIYQFALSADETRAFCRSNRKRIDVRDSASGKLVGSLDSPGDWVCAMSYAAKVNALLAVVWDIRATECSLVLWTGPPEESRPKLIVRDQTLSACAISPDGSIAIGGHEDGAVTVWATAGGRRLRRFDAHAGAVNSVFFSPDGRRVFSADKTEGAVWDVETGGALAKFAGLRFRFRFAAFSPDGDRVVAAGVYESKLRLWDVASAAEVWQLDLQSHLTAVAYSPDGRTVAAGVAGDVSLWDVETRRCLRRFSPRNEHVRCLAFSSDGRRLYAACAPGGLEHWQIDRAATEAND